MKEFLHWSSCVVIGILCGMAYRYHGLTGAIGVGVACVYVACAQWTEGRFSR